MKGAGPAGLRARIAAITAVGIAAGMVLGLALLFLEHDQRRLQVNAEQQLQATRWLLTGAVDASAAARPGLDTRVRLLDDTEAIDATLQRQVLPLEGASQAVALGTLHGRADASVWQISDGRRFVVRTPELGSRVDPPPLPWWPLALATVLGAAAGVWGARGAVRSLESVRRAADSIDVRQPGELLPVRGSVEERAVIRALNAMQERIREQLCQRIRILAAVSHDLKTPLARLVYRIEALPQADARAPLLREVESLRSLVDAMLRYGQSMNDREPLVAMDLNSLLAALVDDAVEAGGTVRLNAAPLPRLQARPAALRRALANLIDNAVRHGGEAAVSAEAAGDHVVVRIVDRGPGVDDDELSSLAQPYFRGRAAQARGIAGHGLGLAIARNVIEDADGRLSLQRPAAGGFEVTVTLPLAGAAAGAKAL
ncbi:MAG: ATP-binding protein [Burkholderiaceae bacterium]|nr:ATP-binding protein [Burkholderiaceae bacterium]